MFTRNYYQQYIIDTLPVVPVEVDDLYFLQTITRCLDRQYDYVYFRESVGYEDPASVSKEQMYGSVGWYDYESWRWLGIRAAYSLFEPKANFTDLLINLPTIVSSWYNSKFP